jgi:hypothetical protein
MMTAFKANPATWRCVSPLTPSQRLLLETAGDRAWFALGFFQASLPMTTAARLCAESW